MADKKISELNSAATVYDADDFALVQDGDTKQVNASAVKAYVKDGLSKSDVGLGNVDNTSDANKPVSTATQTALDLKQDAASAATLTGTQTLTNKTLTSPTINGGTGSFTTLSSTGNTTLGDASADTLTINAGTTTFAQGTANGVLYLNGSKVATSGSGLVFDGSKLVATLSSGGSVTYPAYFNNDGYGVGTGTRIGFRNGAASYGDIGYLYDGAFSQIIDSSGSSNTRLLIGGSETARLTSKGLLVGYTSDSSLSGTGNAIFSGNVGIGTSSPTEILDVQAATGKVRIKSTTGTNSVYAYVQNTGGDFYFGRENSTGTQFGSGTGYSSVLFSGGAYPLAFFTNSTERMRIDSSGNLGLGVTPSYRLDVQAATANTTVASFSGANTHRGLRIATYQSNGGDDCGVQFLAPLANYGAFKWTTGSTDAMTLDASGNLLIGGTSAPTSAIGCLVMYNRSSNPTANIAGGTLYVEAGQLLYRGSSGTVTVIAPA